MANTELVLIADDTETDLRPLFNIIKEDGFQVHEAHNGAQAIEFMEKNRYDLVITDQHPDLPDDMDKLTLDQLRTLINSRNVLYAGEKVDISNDVLAVLDARYRAGAKAQPAAAPVPAPAPATQPK